MKYINIFSAAALLLTVSACTKLDETFRGDLSSVSEQALDAQNVLNGAYNSMNLPFQDQARLFGAIEMSTDAAIGPTRGGDWDDNGVWRVLHSHKWNADHDFLQQTFRDLLQTQYTATNVLLINSATAQQKAEARFIRALSMFSVLDGWDQVPFREGDNFNDLTISPETKKGTAGATFIISELQSAIADLPDGPANKANKDAARALVMKCYLNKGVYANRAAPTFDVADMNQVISFADLITASSRNYSLTPNYFDNFAPANDVLSRENIYTLKNTPGGDGGNNQSRWYMTLHYQQNPSGWNGFTTLSDFYDKFGATDQRRGIAYPGVTNVTGLRVGFLLGQQFDQNGTPLVAARPNIPLAFTREVKLIETGANLEVTGIRVIKYPPDLVNSFPANNDYVIFRYADVLLMKAEAMLRGGTGGAGGALVIVNQLRLARGATSLASVDLNALLDERGRELYWEGWRRNDLVRYGKFLTPFQEKNYTDDPKYLLFAIPNEQLAVNPNLTQNPGY